MSLLILRSSLDDTPPSGGTGDVDLSGLASSASPNTTAYSALNVPAMAAGTSFNDPVTGLRTCKITANGTPGSGQYCPWYSTYGLQISPAWGTNGDMYTISYTAVSGGHQLVDYQLGVGPSNYRAGPTVAGDGRIAFSRTEDRIMFVRSSTQLRRYNCATNAYADTGLFPYTWGSGGSWFQINHNNTWATSLSTSSNTVTALKLSDGTVQTQSSLTGLNELYIGSGDYAFINRGQSSSNNQVWDLNANTLTTFSRPNTNFATVHVPTLQNYWVIFDPNTGSGSLRWTRIDTSGSNSGAVNPANGYWGQIHNSGHWVNGSGTNQYFLTSCWDNDGAWTANMRYSLNLYEANGFTRKVPGHHYSQATNGVGTNPGGTDGYWSQPHASQSTDGKLILFGSNMLDSARIDLFVMELPRAA